MAFVSEVRRHLGVLSSCWRLDARFVCLYHCLVLFVRTSWFPELLQPFWSIVLSHGLVGQLSGVSVLFIDTWEMRYKGG